MRLPIRVRCSVLLLLAAPLCAGAAGEKERPEKVLLVGPEGQVLVTSEGRTRQVAAGPASVLAWSPEGDRVAYVERGDLYGAAPVVLWVASEEGKALASLSIRPGTLVDDVSLEWRDLDRLVWLEGNRLSLSGNFDPANDVLAIADLAAGKVTRAYIGREFSWSPNRAHLARVGWIPHTAPPEIKAHDRLEIDDRTVYPAKGDEKAGGRFLGPLLWAPDGRSLAFLEDRDGTHRLIFLGLDGTARSFPLSGVEKPAILAWADDGQAILVRAGGELVAVERGTGKRVALPEAAVLERFPAYAERQRRQGLARPARPGGADWWPARAPGAQREPVDSKKERKP